MTMSVANATPTPRARSPLLGATRLFNPLALELAGTRLLPLYGVLEHRGRRSGKTFRTPVVVRPTADGFVVPMPWGEPSGEGDEEGESDSVRHDRVEIPDAESSRAPAEFRKELLDAMKQAPPEKYKERVKQYYEELVK